MYTLAVILKKLYNRTALPILRNNQIRQMPQLIRQVQKNRGTNVELEEILKVVQREPRSIIPYEFVGKFKELPVDVFDDKEKGMPYALLNKEKVYFPSAFDHNEIRFRVRQSLWEQADESPHRYLHQKDDIFSGNYAVLIGASDCIFALRILPQFEKVFLFEADSKWHEPMKETLRNYKHKIEIIPKWVGDNNVGAHTTLDRHFEGSYEKIDYIQADIEGDEMKMLWGAEELIKHSPRLKLSVCCYHNAHDEAEITDFLSTRGFEVHPSHGYMLLFMQYPLHYPYLRHGVLYATKARQI